MPHNDALTISIEDRLAIDELYARQSHAVDEGDGERWAATFTEDGVFESPTYRLTVRGPIELADFARRSTLQARQAGRQFRHIVTAILLTPVDADTVSSRAYLMIIATDSAGTTIDRSLVLHDVFRRTEAGWRCASRTVRRDGSAPAAPAGDA